MKKALAEAGEEQAMIFDVHKMMLDDGDYLDAITGLIRSEKVNAEYAVHTTGEQFAAVFASMDDEYMKARSADVKRYFGACDPYLGRHRGRQYCFRGSR